MTGATLLAAAAGALAAPAVVELVAGAAARATRGARDGGRSGPGLLGRLGRGFGWRPPRGLADRIAAAGLDRPVADVMAVKAGAALAGLAAAVVALPVAPGRTGLLLLAAAPAAGFLAPDAALRRRTRRRARAIEAELADVLDLLRVAVAAGLSPGRVLGEVGRRHPGVLARELARAAAHAALGVPRDDLRRARAPRARTRCRGAHGRPDPRRPPRRGARPRTVRRGGHRPGAPGAARRRAGRPRGAADPARRRAAAGAGRAPARRRRAGPGGRPGALSAERTRRYGPGPRRHIGGNAYVADALPT
jgi:hypothetical protein